MHSSTPSAPIQKFATKEAVQFVARKAPGGPDTGVVPGPPGDAASGELGGRTAANFWIGALAFFRVTFGARPRLRLVRTDDQACTPARRPVRGTRHIAQLCSICRRPSDRRPGKPHRGSLLRPAVAAVFNLA